MYDLHSLGWHNFQQLCITIAQELLGQRVERFLDTHDGGRDGAFLCQSAQMSQETLAGHVVFQCKFTSKADHVIKPSDLSDEIAKAKHLVEQGICDSYVLMTNSGLTGKNAAQIVSNLHSVGVKQVSTLGSTWICEQIQQNKRLRMHVPRMYGLGDLSQILDERAYEQSQAILESMHSDFPKVIGTGSYRQAAKALDARGFVLLLGEPASGKTTIASLLAMAAIDNWDASLIKIDEPNGLADHWNPSESSQFFWIDDAFGVNQYQYSTTNLWNGTLSRMKSMIDKGAKIVMTSRDYIYNHAIKDLKISAFPLLIDSQVVIDVHCLTSLEKQQILYNHLKSGKQSRDFRTTIKPLLERVAKHPRFVPETARRLSDPTFTKKLNITPYHLDIFVANREQHLREVVQSLDAASQAALGMIYIRKNRLESPIELEASETEVVDRLGSDRAACISALEALNESLVLYTLENDNAFWRFKHPTVGDAYSELLTQNRELIGIFVQGTSPERFVELVTCGDVGIENAVILPRSMYQQAYESLYQIKFSKTVKDSLHPDWRAKRILHAFLASRCSKQFLEFYLTRHPGLIDEVAKPGMYLEVSSDTRLAARLHSLGLMPEEKRREFIKAVREYAIDFQDPGALNDANVKSVFQDEEFEDMLATIHLEVIPRLDDIRLEYESNYPYDDMPEDHIRPLIEYFEALQKEFGDEVDTVSALGREIDEAWQWVFEKSPEDEEAEIRELGTIERDVRSTPSRSIFDDIDE